MGKSSFINRMSKRTSAIVGNKPGVTRQKQWIRIGNNIELLDTPGVLWPKFESQQVGLNLAFTGSIKQDIMDEVEIAFYLLEYLINNEKKNLMARYTLSEEDIQRLCVSEQEEDNTLNIMNFIGKKRGAILSGGKIDEIKTARILLDDFQSGKIGKITLEKAE